VVIAAILALACLFVAYKLAGSPLRRLERAPARALSLFRAPPVKPERPAVPLRTAFSRAGVPYPPTKVALLGLKEERVLEVWAHHDGKWRFIKGYPVLAASGVAGPKLREGDRQVPEGVYRIIWLNPNSKYHLSMKIDYPNEFDRRHAREDGRTNLGGDIFIHGDAVSIGCLAMGDGPIEELYRMVEKAGAENVKVLIAPHDPRVKPLPRSVSDGPSWVPELYEELGAELEAFRR